MTRSSRRGPWLPEEDEALMSFVRSGGPNNWVRISQQIQHRSPKQCRERYHQNLKPSLKHEPISAQEGEMIEQMIADMGKRWAEIARRLGNRSDNAVKNWWNGSMNRRKRNPTQMTTGFKQVGGRPQPIPFTTANSDTHAANHPQHRTQYSEQWSQSIVPPYRPTSLHIPSPIHTRDSIKSASSTGVLPDGRILTPHPSIFPASACSQPSMSELRPELPPLRPVPRPSLSFTSTNERPLVSPALSETSQAVSLPPVPSLMTDNQSIISTSPNQTFSPRSSVLPRAEHPQNTWRTHPRQSSVLYHSNQYEQHHEPSSHQRKTRSSKSHHDSNSSKDNRMHVSNLLE